MKCNKNHDCCHEDCCNKFKNLKYLVPMWPGVWILLVGLGMNVHSMTLIGAALMWVGYSQGLLMHRLDNCKNPWY